MDKGVVGATRLTVRMWRRSRKQVPVLINRLRSRTPRRRFRDTRASALREQHKAVERTGLIVPQPVRDALLTKGVIARRYRDRIGNITPADAAGGWDQPRREESVAG